MADVHSAEFEALYEQYEKEGRCCGYRYLNLLVLLVPNYSSAVNLPIYLFSKILN